MSENETNEIQRALMELTVNIRHMDSKQDEMINDVKSIKEAIYNPETVSMLVFVTLNSGKRTCRELFGPLV